MRIRSKILLSSASLFALSMSAAHANDTVSGPATFDPYANAETDWVLIDQDATIRADATTNDSFTNNLTMNNGGPNLTIDDSLLFGDIANSGSMISATSTALLIQNDSQVDGRVENSGLISGAVYGINVTDDSTLNGVTNSGTIGAGTAAIFIGDDSELTGGIANSGRIAAASGIVVDDAEAELWGGVSNELGGQIVGGTGAAIYISGAVFEGGISNAGSITGQTSANAILMDFGTFDGDIVNTSTGVIEVTSTGLVAIELTAGIFNGSISNSGQILAEVTTGVAIRSGGTMDFNGNIVNTSTGLISGNSIAIVVGGTTFDGNISNAGSITSASNIGISVVTPAYTGSIINTASGTLTAPNTALLISSTTFTGSITNAGLIDGYSGTGIIVSAPTMTGSITNSGTIEGSTHAVVLTGTTLTGGVVNSGTIFAYDDALRVETGLTMSGGLNNSGLIESSSEDSVDINGVVSGSIVNSGTIDGLRDGIDIDGTVSGGITNSGSIIGETGAGIDLSGADAAATVTQTAGLLRGGDGLTTGTAINMNNANTDSLTATGGVIDGNIVGGLGNSDDVALNPTDEVIYLRGTASNIDQFNKGGAGDALLGASSRGATGTDAVGVTIGAASMTHSGSGTLYMDDDSVVNLSGNFTQSGGTLEFFLTPDQSAGAYGEFNVGGTASLAGDVAAYIDPAAFAAAGGDTFTYQDVIFGTIAGTFANASAITTNSIFFEGEADVNVGDVDLILSRLGFADVLAGHSQTKNQAAVGGALEEIYGNGGYSTEFEDFLAHLFSLHAGDEEEVAHIYDELAGAEHADVQEIALRSTHGFDNMIGERLEDLRGSTALSESASLGLRRYAEADVMVVSDAMPAAGHRRGGGQSVAFWAKGQGDWTDAEGDLEAAGYDQDTYAMAAGVDFKVAHHSQVGVAAGWSQTDVEFVTAGDEAELDSFNAALYAAFEVGQFFADAVLSFSLHDVETVRQVELGFDTLTAVGAYDATTMSLHGEAGWTFNFGGALIEPFANLAYAQSWTDAFNEAGAGVFGLNISDQTAETLTSNLGLRFTGYWSDGGVGLIPSLEVAWRHEFMDTRQSFTGGFAEDPSIPFTIVSSALSRESLAVSAGMGAELEKGFVVFVDYNGLYNSAANSHGASAGLRASW